MINLIGHIINKVEFNEDDQTVSLTVDDNKVFLFRVDANCCSRGKFIGTSSDYSLELPQKVVAVKDREENFDLGDELYRVYEDTFILENGQRLNIVYDNYSNGYYGSSLEAYYNDKHLWEFPKETL